VGLGKQNKMTIHHLLVLGLGYKVHNLSLLKALQEALVGNDRQKN
jgi:hypothetical protein